MPKTVVGLFENARLVDDAVHDIEALGCFMQKVRARTQDENVCRRTIVMKPHGAAQNPEAIGSEYFLG